MELYIAGGTSEHGRNCFYVKEGETAFLVDCGIMKENPEQKYPLLNESRIADVQYIFLTHNHADHAGALGWLYEHGFHGTVVASAFTLSVISERIKGALSLESLGEPKEKIRLEHGITLIYGRSGHCTGSVWYELTVREKTILFSGDYCEHSRAYKCDRIRGRKADLAVLDSAYGYEKTDAKDHLAAVTDGIRETAEKESTMLFPVPVFGRGFDLIRILTELQIPVYAGPLLYRQVSEIGQWNFWFRKKFSEAIKQDIIRPLGEYTEGNTAKAVIVTDSQLYDREDQDLAKQILKEGGAVILTGKQDPSGYSRMLLNKGDARFLRISVHQNVRELMHLVDKNSFSKVIPYHCREKLSFEDSRYQVMKAGERSTG